MRQLRFAAGRHECSRLIGASAIDNIHEIACRVEEEETPKAPFFCNRAVHNFRTCDPNGGLGCVKVIHSDLYDGQFLSAASLGSGVQFNLLGRFAIGANI